MLLQLQKEVAFEYVFPDFKGTYRTIVSLPTFEKVVNIGDAMSQQASQKRNNNKVMVNDEW